VETSGRTRRMRGHARGKGSVAKRVSAMKGLRLIALASALALLPDAAAASHARRHAAKPPPARSIHTPPQGYGNYYVRDVTDSAGNRVPIMQIPGSVVVIPRQVIDDQQDITVCGALRNVSGVFCR
jgi:outer membrane receptor for monomeric catechols